jgi:hypothetical protein
VNRRVLRAGRYAVLVCVLALAFTTTSSAHEDHNHGSGRLDTVSSAQPTDVAPSVSDDAYVARWVDRRTAELDSVATSSATCDGCRGEARTVQVVDARRARHVHADNVATGWSQCTDCGGSAVSVQVVLTRGHRLDLTANNRALAVNTACDGCDSSAAAYQVVLSVRGWVDVRGLRDEVVDWVEAGQPAAEASPNARSLAPAGGPQDKLEQLSGMVSAQGHATVVQKSVQVDGE